MDNKTEQLNKGIEKTIVLHEWLQKLKDGDKVAVESFNYGSVSYSIRKVDRVMPTKIIVSDIVFHRKDGTQIRGKGRDMWGTSITIVPITNYIQNEIRREAEIAHSRHIVRNFKLNVLNDLTLQEAMIVGQSLDQVMNVIQDSLTRMKEAHDLLVADQKLRIEEAQQSNTERLQEGNMRLQDAEESQGSY